MILQLSPETPALVRTAASLALVLHISGASTALMAGPAAMIAKKGSRAHRIAGNVFFVSMLTMSGIGAVVAPMFPDRISALAGAYTFYLTATGWAAVIRPAGKVGRFEVGALIFAAALAVTGIVLGRLGSLSPKGTLDGLPYQLPYAFAALAAVAAACDIGVLMKRGLTGGARIARHLWRMGLALVIAAASFAGQPKAQPEFLRNSPYLFIPALVILAATLVWLVHTRLPKRPRRAQRATGSGLVGQPS